MKFSVTQEKLAKGLQIVSRAIPTKASLPILSNILIEAKDNNLYLSATNLETAIKTNIGASVEEEGVIAIPAKLLKEFVTSLPATNLSAELKGYVLHLKSDKTKTKFNGIDAQDYPQLPTITNTHKSIDVEPKVLEKITQVVTFAAGSDVTNAVFTGTYLQLSDNQLTTVSTDGFRLSELKVNVKNDMGNKSVLIPAKTLGEIAKIFATSEENVKIYLNDKDNLLLFAAEDTLVATRILDGNYPDYKRIIPTESILKATFSSEEFSEAVKITNIFAKEANNTLKVKFDPVEKNIKVSSLAETSGENESFIDADVEGELIEVVFNSKFLMDFFNNVKTTNVEIKINGPVSPCLITSSEMPDFLHIIMPLQV